MDSLFLQSLTAKILAKIIRSYRYIAVNDEYVRGCKRPPVFALLHSVQMLTASYILPYRVNILVSLSKDGEIASRVLERLGFGVVRGSSSRGGKEGLKRLIELVNKGESAAITVDGPRGPYGGVKSGIIKLSYETGVPIICVSAVSKPMFELKRSWDRFIIAPPMAKVLIYFSDPLYIQPANGIVDYEYYKKFIKDRLFYLTEEAHKMLSKI